MSIRSFKNVFFAFIVLTLSMFLIIPQSSASGAVPTADFTGGPTKGCDTMPVQFTDASTGGDGLLSYYWEFYDNGMDRMAFITPGSSTEQNPTIEFIHYGGTGQNAYANVRLTVTDADGDTDVIEKTDYIFVRNSFFGCSEVAAIFTGSPTSGDASLTVSFTNTSSAFHPPLTYEWDFDSDGTNQR